MSRETMIVSEPREPREASAAALIVLSRPNHASFTSADCDTHADLRILRVLRSGSEDPEDSEEWI
jgi:hypothetical protein